MVEDIRVCEQLVDYTGYTPFTFGTQDSRLTTQPNNPLTLPESVLEPYYV